MKPLLILTSVFLISLIVICFFRGNYDPILPGKIALGVMLLFTAIGHFMFTKGMTLMLPGFLPLKTEIIYLTGILEIAFGIGIFIPGCQSFTGWLLIVFLLLILPANVYAAIQNLNIETATFDGPGLLYLGFRIPLQILFIVWTYWFVIRN